METTPIVIVEFFAAYVKNDFPDPHQEFANKLGIHRQDAKELAYKVAYQYRSCRLFEAFNK